MKNFFVFISFVVFVIWGTALAQELPPPEQGTENTEVVPKEAELPEIAVEHIIIRDGDNTLFEGDAPLPEEGLAMISDSGGESQEINARSVLALLYELDRRESAFEISELIYYPSFGAFYLKCISFDGEEKCDNWLYEINGDMPAGGMDNEILSGGEDIEIYYSSFLEEPDPEEPALNAEVDGGEDTEEDRITISSSSRAKKTLASELEAISEPEPAQVVMEEAQTSSPTVATPQIASAPSVIKVQREPVPIIKEPSPLPENTLLVAAEEGGSSVYPWTITFSLIASGVIVSFSRRFIVKK